MVVIDMATFVAPKSKDTPAAYESRCIVNDAMRAAMMCDPIEKACFWRPGTPQYELWTRVYYQGAKDVQ